MKKNILITVAVLVAIAVAVVLLRPKPESPTDEKPTRILVADAKTTHHLNLYVAKELGLFEKHNLDVEILPVEDLAAARDLLVSGQADVFWSCPTVAIAAIANGAPLRIISQVKKPCTSVLLVPPDSPINAYTDLTGKNLAGISPTCEAVIALSLAVRNAGGGEFNLQRLAGGPALAALESRAVDGAILEEPHASIAELKGYRVLFREASENIPCRTINARTAFLESNAEDLKNLIKAVDEANAIIASNPTAPKIVDIAHLYTGAPKDAIKHGNHRLLFRTAIDREGLSLLADELVALDATRENPGDRLYAEQFRGITW